MLNTARKYLENTVNSECGLADNELLESASRVEKGASSSSQVMGKTLRDLPTGNAASQMKLNYRR